MAYKLYKVEHYSSFYIGKCATVNACIRKAAEMAEIHNLKCNMVEITKKSVFSPEVYEYDVPAWVEPHKKGDSIVYTVATHYAYKRKPISVGSKLADNVDVINYADERDSRTVEFVWKEV